MINNLRDQIANNIVEVLKDIQSPRPVLVTREPFDVEKIAITQFPALLITPVREERETVSMGPPGTGRRLGEIEFQIRGFVRGVELDRQRSDLVLGIESALEGDRYRDFYAEGVLDSQITLIEVVDRMPPLAEITVTLLVRYNYLRSAV